ncbi:MAG: Na+/Ca+ antiporter, CaCA family [candidate division WWE3 bacterium GW2011_GWA1_41_8]|jgi:cation:H+ antiporter|uniref:Na+/Ca+ antiporter, CaCA family n=2 Tax=Katanobacteria TaxID=422282 RepID=A0A0G1AAW0_UNCKA|nr:MAG: Na+/Ca+ antiporter, CaCA family [candidate division WWE3 bacterium GW2011_GWB1_41_6]KKS22438.1 MAG: Na+/Ca+ antiporter, CaCA family [candidate division WWE3 bacterium GW2011_GWA1_41_8]
MIQDLSFLLIAFLVLWVGSGISISGVEKVSRYVKIPSFLISFFALGVLTSVSEISVAYFSIIDKTPGISVGNLIGGSVVLSLLIIPLLVVLNKGIHLNEKAEPINFPFAFLVISLPVILVLDNVISIVDAFVMIFSFGLLVMTISRRNTLLDKIEEVINHHNVNIFIESLKILFGIVLIIISCKFIVDTAVLYANKFSVAPFLIGLILLSIGTNLPELTVLIRSTILKKKTIALGDYIGSAALNTLILGFLTLFYRQPIQISGGIKYNLLLLPIGAALFLLFTRNKKLDRKEGAILLSLYVLFIILELWLRPVNL